MASAQQALAATAPVHNAVATATAREREARIPSALAQARLAHEAGRRPPAACSACAAPFEHAFDRLRVHAHSAPAVQPKLFIGAPGDRFEQEADAVAEQVMRQAQPTEPAASRSVAPLPGRASAAGGFETLQRQSVSPFSIDDGLLTEADGEPEGDAAPPLQAKLAPGGRPGVAPGVAGRIQALRAQGSPLPAPVRSFMETRFGHDFGKVRVHTGSAATAVAARINARAFTIGRDIVFGDGQFASHSAAGQRLIAHELTHVVQQGHAPKLAQAAGRAGAAREPGADVRAPQRALVSNPDPQAALIRRVKWHPNKSSGKTSAPWGSGGPTGEVLKGQTDAGTAIDIWHPADGKTYWCHGYTFGGMTAKGGPYSVWGETVPTVLKDDGWKQTLSCMAQASDILVFWDAQGMVTHSGIIRKVSATGGRVDDATSMLESKWGSGAHNTSSWETNAKSYGRYRCFSKAPVTGVCSGNGANEQ